MEDPRIIQINKQVPDEVHNSTRSQEDINQDPTNGSKTNKKKFKTPEPNTSIKPKNIEIKKPVPEGIISTDRATDTSSKESVRSEIGEENKDSSMESQNIETNKQVPEFYQQ